MTQRLFIPPDPRALESGLHANRDECRLDDGQRSKPPEDVLRVQGRIRFLIIVRVRVLQVSGDPAR